MLRAMKPTFFRTPAAFRAWLDRNHDKVRELVVGFHKMDSGRPSVTYPEALDEALCFGWIDGVRRSLDADSYTIRFTPRKTKSYWSLVNLRKVKVLIEAGRMAPAGLAAYERRDESTAQKYSFENRPSRLPPAYEKRLRANKVAWADWNSRPPGYRRTAAFWVTSAKLEATRERRLASLIAAAAARRMVPPLEPPARGTRATGRKR